MRRRTYSSTPPAPSSARGGAVLSLHERLRTRVEVLAGLDQVRELNQDPTIGADMERALLDEEMADLERTERRLARRGRRTRL